MSWRKTGVAVAAMPLGGLREVMVGSTAVLLVRLSDGIFAVDAICPHLAGLLGDGTLSGHRLKCPEHSAVFDVRTGTVLADAYGVEPAEGTVAPLEAYPTRVAAGMIEVDLPGP
jgi:nitrite reductase/ring-hydroxylating ferredoxin subunit